MGMFDFLILDLPTPDDRETPSKKYQTKSFDSALDTYRITDEGRLLVSNMAFEDVPEEEWYKPLDNSFFESWAHINSKTKVVDLKFVETAFTGIVHFYDYIDTGDTVWEAVPTREDGGYNRTRFDSYNYAARFYQGQLIWLVVADENENYTIPEDVIQRFVAEMKGTGGDEQRITNIIKTLL